MNQMSTYFVPSAWSASVLQTENRFTWIIRNYTDFLQQRFSTWNDLICCTTDRGTQRESLRKRPENNNKACLMLSEAILSILGDCWENLICSTLPARLMGEFPASKVHLHLATWLTGKLPSWRLSHHYWPVWVWAEGGTFQWGEGSEG